jgi:hypothetical protein
MSNKFILNIIKTKEKDFGALNYNIGEVEGTATYEFFEKKFLNQPLVFHYEKRKLVIKGDTKKADEILGDTGIKVKSWSTINHEELLEKNLIAIYRLFYESFRQKLLNLEFFIPPKYRKKDAKSAFSIKENIGNLILAHEIKGKVNGLVIEGFTYSIEISNDGEGMLTIDPKTLPLINYDKRYYHGNTVFPFCRDKTCKYFIGCNTHSIGVGFISSEVISKVGYKCNKYSENLVVIEDLKGKLSAIPEHMLYYEAYPKTLRVLGLSEAVKNKAIKKPHERKKYLDFYVQLLKEGNSEIAVHYHDGDEITLGSLEIIEVS